MTGLFDRSEKEKKAVAAQSKRRTATKFLKENIKQKQKKENTQMIKQRNKRRKESRC